jgi:hypothetical protein
MFWTPDDPLPSSVTFHTNGLYSKWGFNDGDLLDYLFPGLIPEERHKLLFEIVQVLILPRLDQEVRVFYMPSSHNPVRAERVNGTEVVWEGGRGTGEPLTPEVIELPFDLLIEVKESSLW